MRSKQLLRHQRALRVCELLAQQCDADGELLLVGGVAEYSILPLATLQLLAGVLYSNALSVQYFGSLLQRLLAARLAKVCMSDSNASYPLKYDCEPNLAVASAFALSLAVCWPGASLSA